MQNDLGYICRIQDDSIHTLHKEINVLPNEKM